MGEIFLGTEAVAAGVVTRHELARWCRPVFPNVHVPKGQVVTLRDLAVGAWLWSGRTGIVTGLAAARLHGAAWIPDDADVELIFENTHPPRGIVARNERIASDEWDLMSGVPVANAARTAFDLGRFRRRLDAVVRLDALMRVSPYSTEDVMMLTKRYRGARGVARVKAALPFVDGGAQSPMETYWRMLVVHCGFPSPATQIPIFDEDGYPVRVVDFGWEELKVAVEYDGDQHQSNRAQYLKDRDVMRILRRRGWEVLCVVREDRRDDVIARLHRAMVSRGWSGISFADAVTRSRETEFQQRKFE
ncbi:DUF559 domain-containing protein [Mycobacterium sp. 236(2023)]|uniref:DUF559 domain-containing protein n=1 Tax=Mycobacterium sp. 236(2023) TaxID=3038163 RepID=UPI002414E7ED|nr:DUF559 domain-containing protein [Mycobacterium sp. 236(2023)]MDG4663643.1 DUF559 domain-containing protein [Mycobacterium sp. 236(2023)]